ncbi:hypothetical protein [Chenggangzhangella methanolivorans]|uniref:Glycosyltransferase n=1 Tax=Chenggangzhangella methanolivorans TaxID=1437009 RepID=A0A9E6UJV1_9HYPH|nr:hypothetical protein [Chenggangzhangella methanolivorans]QZN98516.1 hypothetical protein K6K41_15830 [Chenggangzhangella methanolivorans]
MAEITNGATRIFIVADAVGATQLISFLQPFQDRISAGEVSLAFEAHGKDQAALIRRYEDYRPDILVMSRYSLADGAPLIERAREARIPVVFHIDDDLLNVPTNIGPKKYEAYTRPERLAALRSNMDAADVIYVSTHGLAETFAGYRLKAPLVTGDLYCSVDPAALREPRPSAAPIVGYMGSEGHSADLALVVPVLERLMEEIPTLRFETYGTIKFPPELARFGDRVGHHAPHMNYAAFLAKLCTLGWWVGLAPLEPTVFNNCKADTKWVEYSFAGIATVASDGPVYASACAGGSGLLAEGEAEWGDAIRRLLRDDVRQDVVGRARRKLASHYSHDLLQRQILQIFELAAEKSKERPAPRPSDEVAAVLA